MNFLKGLVGGGTTGSGQRLGSTAPASSSSSSAHRSPAQPQAQQPQLQTVDVTFTAEEKQLGMTILPAGHPQGSASVVGAVAPGGTAHKKGVRKGDRVVAVDGNPVQDFDALEATLAAIGRPVTFRFERLPVAVAVPVSGGAPVPPAGAAVLSPQDRERAARRAAMAAAAEERTKAWSKKSGGNSRAKEREEKDGRFRAASDPKTLESVARIKAAEQQEAIYQSHSYGQSQARARIELAQPAPGLPMMPSPNGGGGHPFTPSPNSGNGGSSSNNSPSSAFPAPGVVGPPSSLLGNGEQPPQEAIPPLSQEEAESPEALMAEDEFDLALSTLLDQDDPLARKTAMDTALQILTNVLRQPFNKKVRRIKTSNAAFQTKIAGCRGGVELLTSAGFAFVADEGEETFLAIVDPPPPMVPLRARVVYHRLRQTVAHMQEM